MYYTRRILAPWKYGFIGDGKNSARFLLYKMPRICKANFSLQKMLFDVSNIINNCKYVYLRYLQVVCLYIELKRINCNFKIFLIKYKLRMAWFRQILKCLL